VIERAREKVAAFFRMDMVESCMSGLGFQIEEKGREISP
jgi:hypothetical protein